MDKVETKAITLDGNLINIDFNFKSDLPKTEIESWISESTKKIKAHNQKIKAH